MYPWLLRSVCHVANLPSREAKKVELYINSAWTRQRGDDYVAETIGWSENGNHATIYATGVTADEADAKHMGALRELKLVPDLERKERVSQ